MYIECTSVGLSAGNEKGAVVGSIEGLLVGTVVGVFDGDCIGASDGAFVDGSFIGDIVGWSLSVSAGSSVGFLVGA